MVTMHDAAYRSSIESRLQKLTPNAPRHWGKMTVDQMLWHVNTAMELALGLVDGTSEKPGMPRALLRFAVLRLPWPKGAPTAKDTVPKMPAYDFEAEKKKALRLVGELSMKDLSAKWADSPVLGPMSGKEWSCLQAKHLDHHLRQFGA